MLKRQITRDAEKALDKMTNKHFCQVYEAIEALRVQPEPEDSKELVSNVRPKRRRKDVYLLVRYRNSLHRPCRQAQ